MTPSVDESFFCEIETNLDTKNLTITTTQIYLEIESTGVGNYDTGHSEDVYALTEISFVFNLSRYYENISGIRCIICNYYPITPRRSTITFGSIQQFRVVL
jgi:hypothetical protein